MQYRKFGKFDWQASALGFGCMRLPTTDGMPISEKIDEAEATAMLRLAIDRGVNYVDTAYPYHGGRSEVVLGQALKGGYREKVKLVTKSPVWLVNEAKDFDTYLNEQLQKLADDHIDIYLFHGLSARRWDTLLEQGLLERAEAAVRDGHIGHIGFSFHDRLEAFKRIVDEYDGWALAQIQYNYMDTHNQAGTEGLRHAAAAGLAVVVMEPLLGGSLAKPPDAVKELFAAAGVSRSPADLALQWIWSQPEVSLVLSGMSAMPQVEENLASADASGPDDLTAHELELVARVRSWFEERTAVNCTNCGYCLPCPAGVNIPGIFELLNYGVMYDSMLSSCFRYQRFFPEDERASACTGCAECEEQCPQGIGISELMPRAQATLAEGKPFSHQSPR